jgi:hypothetical protein
MSVTVDNLWASCPTCGWWPMAIQKVESGRMRSRITFRCGRCRGRKTSVVSTDEPARRSFSPAGPLILSGQNSV